MNLFLCDNVRCSGKGAVGLEAVATGNRLADSVDPAVFRTLPQLQDIQVRPVHSSCARVSLWCV